MSTEAKAPKIDAITRSIRAFIDKEYKKYAQYVVKERAIPHIIDGLKPSQRKGLFIVEDVGKKFKKVEPLAGAVAQAEIYMHGSGSMAGAISLMTAPWNNNLPLFEGEGVFGSRLNTSKGIAASRYVSARISPNFYKFFKDSELIEMFQEEGIPEPRHFLPIIPWILINGTNGMAIGHACDYLRYHYRDVVENMVRCINGKPMVTMLPHFEDFRGRIFSDGEGVYCEGTAERKNLSTTIITELPFGITRETYVEKVLFKLRDADGSISSFDDECGAGFRFVVSHRRDLFEGKTDDEVISFFKLRSKISENLTCITETGKIRKFKDPLKIIEYFVNYKMREVYPRRRQLIIDKIAADTRYFDDLVKMLSAVIETKDLDPSKIDSRKDLIAKLTHIGVSQENVDRIASVMLYRITKEALADARKELGAKEKELVKAEAKTVRSYFDDDMKDLTKG